MFHNFCSCFIFSKRTKPTLWPKFMHNFLLTGRKKILEVFKKFWWAAFQRKMKVWQEVCIAPNKVAWFCILAMNVLLCYIYKVWSKNTNEVMSPSLTLFVNCTIMFLQKLRHACKIVIFLSMNSTFSLLSGLFTNGSTYFIKLVMDWELSAMQWSWPYCSE